MGRLVRARFVGSPQADQGGSTDSGKRGGESLDAYFKTYATCRHAWDGLGRRSRAVWEARNLENFRRWGIPAPKVVAWGYRRRGWGCCSDRSFLITETVPGARPLRDVWLSLDSPAATSWRESVIDQLALQTRTLHGHRCFHQDLKWRNLLVDDEARLAWIDCPKGYVSRWRWRQRHGRIKDLATLDKVAVHRCTESERRRFLTVYLKTEDEAEIDRWARAVVAYRRRRQD